MPSLKAVWNNLKCKIVAADIFDPPYEVQKELEAQGWTFRKEDIDIIAASMMMAPISFIYRPHTPEGERILGEPALEKRYTEALKAAATKIYKQNAPSP